MSSPAALPSTWGSDHDWRQAAACRDLDTTLFFVVGTGPDALAKEARAKAVCATCPVRLECLEYAIVTNQENGVWGGMGEEERGRERRRRRREAATRKAS